MSTTAIRLSLERVCGHAPTAHERKRQRAPQPTRGCQDEIRESSFRGRTTMCVSCWYRVPCVLLWFCQRRSLCVCILCDCFGCFREYLDCERVERQEHVFVENLKVCDITLRIIDMTLTRYGQHLFLYITSSRDYATTYSSRIHESFA